jgi:hypothetical protein
MIKMQANCQYHVISWELGKKKESLHSFGSFDRFTEASASLNGALKSLGLEEQVITRSNVESEQHHPGSHKTSASSADSTAADLDHDITGDSPHARLEETISIKKVTTKVVDGATVISESESEVLEVAQPHASSSSHAHHRTSSSERDGTSPSKEDKKDSVNKKSSHKSSNNVASAATVKKPVQIERLVVIGERNTGTNWLFQLLEANFNVTVLNHFCGKRDYLIAVETKPCIKRLYLTLYDLCACVS